MRFKEFLLGLLVLVTLLSLAGCGASGGEGLNGAVTLSSATAEGTWVTAVAKYTNPDTTKVIGTQISFYVVIDGEKIFVVKKGVDSVTGEAGVLFEVPAFNGSKNILVIAESGKLGDTKVVSVAGRTIALTPPANVSLTAVAGSAATKSFTIGGIPNFVTITNPFTDPADTVIGNVLNITYTVTSSTGSAYTLNVPATTTVLSNGSAPFPGATGTITIPATAGDEVLTINWTVTDPLTGLVASGTTTVTLTATEPVVGP